MSICRSSESKLSVRPHKFAIVQLGMQSDLVTRIFRNVKAVVRSVRRTRRNQMHVNCGAIRPGISLVDRISVRIDEQRLIKMRPFFDGPFAVVLDLAAPEKRLPLFIKSLQLKPYVEGIDSSTGEKVADLARANDNIDADVIAPTHRSIHAAEWGSNGARLAGRAIRQRSFRFLAHRKCRGQLGAAHFRV